METDLIGKELGGIRRTDTGFVRSSWWFFQREFEDKDKPYWYAKKRAIASAKEEEGKVKEKYIGKDLPFKLPRELMTRDEWGRYLSGDVVIQKESPDSDRSKMLALKHKKRSTK